MGKPINLAFQGGGAHGAFTWGVADRLLEDGRLDINAITATSAGAMNAVALAYGMHLGGREGAREKLAEFWNALGRSTEAFDVLMAPLAHMLPWAVDASRTLAYMTLEAVSLGASPYQLNPLNINPLANILRSVIDFDELNRCSVMELFVSATNVRSGKVRVFETNEVCEKAVLASACLPQLFQAVERDGEYYWDGGFMGNPSLWPLFYETSVEDLLVVHINPIERCDVPDTPSEITNRINEISFNTALLKEMRAIAFVQKLLHEGWIKDEYRGRLSDIRYHAIRAEDVFTDLGVASKYDTSRAFLHDLRDKGRAAASKWLDEDYDAVGQRSSVDLHEEFLTHGFDEDQPGVDQAVTGLGTG